MKEIKAIIKLHKMDEVLHALQEIRGLPGCIVSRVTGYGRSLAEGPAGTALESAEWAKLELVVSDQLVEPILKVIQARAHTGHKGDGKVFVIQAVDALAIRTGKRGNEAI